MSDCVAAAHSPQTLAGTSNDRLAVAVLVANTRDSPTAAERGLAADLMIALRVPALTWNDAIRALRRHVGRARKRTMLGAMNDTNTHKRAAAAAQADAAVHTVVQMGHRDS